ncbi:MAG: hypothetical protein SPL13_05810, partial [Clostridia bacterium]|nr:hypothetical protein [Clostridia bacterium]
RRDSTGKLLTDGNGQINFKLICDEGFEVDEISVEGTYKNIKTPSDTKVLDLYRITKIESALTVSVTVTESTEEDYTDAYTVTFSGEHFTVYVYKTQDVSGDGEQTSLGYARNSTTGKLDNSGSGQINFKVVPDEGYEVTSVTADQNYNKLNTYENNVYRITKISGNVAVTIVCNESAN